MAPNPASIVVAPGGAIYAAPEGTAEPAGPSAALNAAFTDLGIVSEDGATFRTAPTIVDIGAWHSEYPQRTLTERREGSLGYVLREWKNASILHAFGGGSITAVTGGFKFSPPAGVPDVVCVVIEWEDEGFDFRIVVPRAQPRDAIEVPLRRSAAADLPVAMSILGAEGGGDPFYWLSDAPGFS